MTEGPWWEAAPPVEAVIECSGARHRLRWDNDLFSAPDHPDPDGERLLVSLGAPPSRCLRLIELWEAHTDDVRALTLGSRDAHDQPRFDLDTVTRFTPTFLPPSTHRQPTGLAALIPRYYDLAVEDRWRSWIGALELLDLPAALQIRWGATVADALLQRMPDRTAAAAAAPADLGANPAVMTTKDLERSAPGIALAILDAALIGRARRAAARWLGPDISIDIDVLAPSDATPTLRRSPAHVDMALRHDWLTRVWGRDLAVVKDAFTLDAIVTGPTGGTLHLATYAGETRRFPIEFLATDPARR